MSDRYLNRFQFVVSNHSHERYESGDVMLLATSLSKITEGSVIFKKIYCFLLLYRGLCCQHAANNKIIRPNWATHVSDRRDRDTAA